jgi:hypothetical protein
VVVSARGVLLCFILVLRGSNSKSRLFCYILPYICKVLGLLLLVVALLVAWSFLDHGSSFLPGSLLSLR